MNDDPSDIDKRLKGHKKLILMTISLSITLLISMLSFYLIRSITSTSGEFKTTPQDNITLVAGLSALLVVVMATVFSSYSARMREEKVRQDSRKRLEIIEEEEKRIASSSDKDDISLPKLWALNNQRINSYHAAAVDQSVKSFRSTQYATSIGLIVVLVSAICAAFANSPLATVLAGSVGIIGGALSAYISSTFMKTQAAATEQLRRFFNHPVELSRMLSAERLLKDLNNDDRSEATKLIIKAMLEGHLNETNNRGSNEK